MRPCIIWDVGPRARCCHTRPALPGEEIYRLGPYGSWQTEAALVWWIQGGPIHGGVPVVESMVVAP